MVAISGPGPGTSSSSSTSTTKTGGAWSAYDLDLVCLLSCEEATSSPDVRIFFPVGVADSSLDSLSALLFPILHAMGCYVARFGILLVGCNLLLVCFGLVYFRLCQLRQAAPLALLVLLAQLVGGWPVGLTR